MSHRATSDPCQHNPACSMTPPKDINQIPIPGDYGNEHIRKQRAYRRIFNTSGFWPWEFLGQYTPSTWANSTTEVLACCVDAIHKPSCRISMQDLTAELIRRGSASSKGIITKQICDDTKTWIVSHETTNEQVPSTSTVPQTTSNGTLQPSPGRDAGISSLGKRRRLDDATLHTTHQRALSDQRTDFEPEQEMPSRELIQARIDASRTRLSKYKDELDMTGLEIDKLDQEANEALAKATLHHAEALSKADKFTAVLDTLQELAKTHEAYMPRNPIADAEASCRNAHQDVEQAKVELENRRTEHLEKRKTLQKTIEVMRERIEDCEREIKSEELTLCITILKHIEPEVLSRKPAEEISQLRRLVEMLETGGV